MSVRAAGNLSFSVATKSWAASLAVHLAMLSTLVAWQGPAPEAPRMHSHLGPTSMLLSAADPTPGVPDENDSIAEPAFVIVDRLEEPQPVPPVEQETLVDVEEIAPAALSLDVQIEKPMSLMPPLAALEPIDQPRDEKPIAPPPGDETPTASPPSPGRLGNDRPSEPEFASNPPILYPPAAARAAIEGTVLLRIHIGVDGAVVEVELVQSSGSSILDRAAIDGVRTWRGRPAQIAGHAIEAAALLPVVFRLH